MFNWENLKYLLCFANLGTLSKTANLLGVEHATVSRRIEALERELNIPLIDKRGKRWKLTPDGKKLIALSMNIPSQMNQINLLSASRKTISGTVTISAPPAYAVAKLVKPLVKLQTQYPDLSIQLIGSTDIAALNSGEADIAIRLSRPEEGDLIISQIDTMVIRPFASKEYMLTKNDKERNFIGYNQSMSSAPQQQILKELAKSRNFDFLSNSIEIQMQAAIEGGGIVMLPDFMVNDGQLVPAYPDVVPIIRKIWLVVPSAIRNSPAIDAVIKAIKS